MLKKTVSLLLATILTLVLTVPEVHAWPRYHVGYTHVGPGGVSHWGRTGGVGPYGAWGRGGAWGAGWGGYHAGYGYHYGGLYGARWGGYHYGGYVGYGGLGGVAPYYGYYNTYDPGFYPVW